MKLPTILVPAFAILLGACATSEPTASTGTSAARTTSTTTRKAEPPPPPASVASVTGHAIRVEWRNLKPSTGQSYLGIINRSSPELAKMYRDPAAWEGVKPVDDDTMANVLAAFHDSKFFELAQQGKDVRSFAMGDGNGVVSLIDGEKKWALFLPRMTDPATARSSPVPVTYRDLKVLILNVHSQTLFLAPAEVKDSERVFKVPPPSIKR